MRRGAAGDTGDISTFPGLVVGYGREIRRFLLVFVAVALLAAEPASASQPCRDYQDVYAIRTSGATCATARAVFAALYRQGFNAVATERATVAGRRWRCRGRGTGRAVIGGRCVMIGGPGRITYRMDVDY